MRKLAPARDSPRNDFFISVSRLQDDWAISYRLYMKVDFILIQNRKYYAYATRPSLAVDRFHTDTSGRSALLRLHDTVDKFRTGVKFSLRYNKRCELKPVRLAPSSHFVVVSYKQIQRHKREPEWTRAAAKVTPVSCKQVCLYYIALTIYLPIG